MKILFFGSLREQLGTGELELTLPDHVQTVSDLVSTLKQRGEQWQQGLGQGQFLCAINQVMTFDTASLSDNDELALFPPVTGG